MGWRLFRALAEGTRSSQARYAVGTIILVLLMRILGHGSLVTCPGSQTWSGEASMWTRAPATLSKALGHTGSRPHGGPQ